MRDQVADRVGIADDEPVETPLLTQHLGEEPPVPGPGIPLRSMYAVITLPAPAARAAWNGGKYTFQSSESDRLTSS